jgi:hypothetical protein
MRASRLQVAVNAQLARLWAPARSAQRLPTKVWRGGRLPHKRPVARGPPGRHRRACLPQVAFLRTPLRNRRFCETVLRGLPGGPDTRAGGGRRRAPSLPQVRRPARQPCRTGGGKTAARYHTARFILMPALREELNVAVPPGPGTRQIVVAGADHRLHGGRGARGQADPGRVRALLHRAAGAGQPAGCAGGGRVHPGLLGEDLHPGQGQAGAREGDRAVPGHQGRRAGPGRDPDRARDEAPGSQRRRADDPGRCPAGRGDPAGAFVGPADRDLRPQRDGRDAVRGPGRGRPARPRVHPGEDAGGPASRRREGQSRRATEGHRRRHADLRRRPAG